jgi:NAD(P)-dependent dehydrogenase (short-subunit alcohol dehydrogenase family)
VDLGVRDHGYLFFGGTSGIGLAAARTLALDGASIVLVGRDGAKAEAAAALLRAETRAAVTALPGDLTVEDEAERIVAAAVERLGGLRGVAVTTGLGLSGHRNLVDATDDDWRATFDDVLLTTVHACRASVPALVEGGGGAIVTTAAYSIRAAKGDRLPYASLKASVATLTKSLATSWGHAGVRANCVCPGATETDALASIRPVLAEQHGWPVDEAIERAMVEHWGMQVALGRPGRADEVGDVIAFLLSERAGYLTGALVNVDGGTNF